MTIIYYRPRSVSMFGVVSINQRSLPTPSKTPHYYTLHTGHRPRPVDCGIPAAMAQDTPILERNPSLKPVDTYIVCTRYYLHVTCRYIVWTRYYLLLPVQTASGQLEADIASLVRSSALVASTTSPDNPLLPVTAQVAHCRPGKHRH